MLPDHQALVQSLALNPNLEQITPGQVDTHTRRLTTSTPDHRSELATAAIRAASVGEEPNWAEFVAVVSMDLNARDQALAAALQHRNTELLAALTDTLTRTPDGRAADLAAILALVAYRVGNGPLANVAIDRALASDPDHRLSQLASTALISGMPPQHMDAIVTELIH